MEATLADLLPLGEAIDLAKAALRRVRRIWENAEGVGEGSVRVPVEEDLVSALSATNAFYKNHGSAGHTNNHAPRRGGVRR